MRAILCLILATGACLGAEPDLETHCLDCHGPEQRRGDVPVIEGQHREYLEHQLLRFRERHRESFPMSSFVRGFDDAALRMLAGRLAARTWRDAGAAGEPDAVRRGAVVARERDCEGCHGAGFEGAGDIARLAGQHPGYLARQIESFGLGLRFHPPSGTGAPMRGISPAQAADLAAFLATIDPGTARPARQPQD